VDAQRAQTTTGAALQFDLVRSSAGSISRGHTVVNVRPVCRASISSEIVRSRHLSDAARRNLWPDGGTVGQAPAELPRRRSVGYAAPSTRAPHLRWSASLYPPRFARAHVCLPRRPHGAPRRDWRSAGAHHRRRDGQRKDHACVSACAPHYTTHCALGSSAPVCLVGAQSCRSTCTRRASPPRARRAPHRSAQHSRRTGARQRRPRALTARAVPQIVGVTQPRRVAAITVAQRVALEVGAPLGEARARQRSAPPRAAHPHVPALRPWATACASTT
jgi:hypothetical protein